MNVPPDTVMSIPSMGAAALLALARSLQTSLATVGSDQAKASEAQAANSRARRRQEPESVAAVPVAIPGNIPSCMKRLDGVCATLAVARRGTTGQAANRPVSSVRQRLPGRYRKAWNTVTGQLHVWRKAGVIDELPEASRASLVSVFGESLSAPELSGSAAAAWIKGSDTLDRIKAAGVDALFTSLGGGRVLANLTRVHAEVGATFGVTVATPSTSVISVRDAIAAVRSVLGEYVIKVQAMIDPDVPGSEAVASSLLAPLVELSKSARPVKKAKVTKTAPVKPPVTQREGTDTEHVAAPQRPTGTG